MESSDSDISSAEPFQPAALVSTLFGECLAMLLTVHVVFTALIWIMTGGPVLSAGYIVVAAFWIVSRAYGFAAGKWGNPVVTAMLFIFLCWGLPVLSSGSAIVWGPFSIRILALMLAIVLWMDLTECYSRYISDPAGFQASGEFIRRHGLRILWYGMCVVFVVCVLIVPAVEEWQHRQAPPPEKPVMAMERLDLGQNMLFRSCQCLAAFFFFVVGTCVGSFLNVVIYRVPNGVSVLAKASHCPGCSQPINSQDNIPMVGWLRLGGRCRNCDVDISARYPTVELCTGLAFLLLYFVELISGGTNLPGRTPNGYAGVLWILFYTKWDLLGLYLFHCLLLCTLFSWAMIRRDGHHIPLLSAIVMLVIIVGLPSAMPHLLPYPAMGYSGSTVPYHTSGALVTSACGIAAGLCAALLARGVFSVAGKKLIPDDIPSWLLLGAGVGWQAVVGVIVLVMIWEVVFRVHCLIIETDSVCKGSELSNRWLVFPWIVLVHHLCWRNLLGHVVQV